MERTLARLYYNPADPAGFSTAEKLYQATQGRYKKKDIAVWLSGQDTYTLHKSIRKNFDRNKYIVDNIDNIWQMDLNDMRKLSRHNDGYNYILVVVDIFSKFVWAVCLKRKTPQEVCSAIKKILKKSGRKPFKVNSDKGMEFRGKYLQDFFKAEGIHFYTTQNPDTKASCVERVNRTLKTRMQKYLTFKNTNRYIDVLPKIVKSYNLTKHSATKMAPSEVNGRNILKVWHNLYPNIEEILTSQQTPAFKEGDYVRITRERGKFDKGYDQNWSREIFVVSAVHRRQPPVYSLEDLEKEPIVGTFYEEELQKVSYVKTSLFHIDKILKQRTKRRSIEYLVSWKGYPKKFNTWVSAATVKQI
jgi:hypothetical protein